MSANFYKINPNPTMVEVGTVEIGVIELKRLNYWVPAERDFYNALIKEFKNYDDILAEFAGSVSLKQTDSNLTEDDILEMLSDDHHTEYRKQAFEENPEEAEKFNTALYTLYEQVAVARAKTMVQVRLAQQFEDGQDLVTAEALRSSSFDLINTLNQDLIVRLDSFARCELAGDRSLDYSLFSEVEFSDPQRVADSATEAGVGGGE